MFWRTSKVSKLPFFVRQNIDSFIVLVKILFYIFTFFVMKNRKKKVSLMLLSIFTISILATININPLNVNAGNTINFKDSLLKEKNLKKLIDDTLTTNDTVSALMDERLIPNNNLCNPDWEYIYQLANYWLEQLISAIISKKIPISDKSWNSWVMNAIGGWISTISDWIIKTFEYWTQDYREYVCEYWNAILKLKSAKQYNLDEIWRIKDNLDNIYYQSKNTINVDFSRYDKSYNNIYSKLGNTDFIWFLKFSFWTDSAEMKLDFIYFDKALKKDVKKFNDVSLRLTNIRMKKIVYNRYITEKQTILNSYNKINTQKIDITTKYNYLLTQINKTNKNSKDYASLLEKKTSYEKTIKTYDAQMKDLTIKLTNSKNKIKALKIQILAM